MVIKTIIYTKKFENNIRLIKDRRIKERIEKQIKKIIENPETGKPLRFDLKGEKTVYIKPFRLLYTVDKDKLILLRFLHRKDVYK